MCYLFYYFFFSLFVCLCDFTALWSEWVLHLQDHRCLPKCDKWEVTLHEIGLDVLVLFPSQTLLVLKNNPNSNILWRFRSYLQKEHLPTKTARYYTVNCPLSICYRNNHCPILSHWGKPYTMASIQVQYLTLTFLFTLFSHHIMSPNNPLRTEIAKTQRLQYIVVGTILFNMLRLLSLS